ncbi:hypothetical protein [Enterococcus casseliflavus]|uniref:hypothetical protein n=1 Tax=Enterococcus casseliflavus TaxID=37734 RepID=UPI0022E7FE43|nr:hypothetical protein [Enterococcus casseliflavus]
MNNIEVNNDYLAYMLGLMNGEYKDKNTNLDFFIIADSPEEASEKYGFDDIHQAMSLEWIPSYSVSQSINDYGGFESSHLLSIWISKALNLKYHYDYKVNEKAIQALLDKPNYKEIERSVIVEIKRIYSETQNYLNNAFNAKYVTLKRCLNYKQENEFNNNKEVKFNFLTSFFDENSSLSYPGRNQILKLKVDKKYIFAYTNLSYNNNTLGYLENEVLVIGLPTIKKIIKNN